jgi:hypothetical protein
MMDTWKKRSAQNQMGTLEVIRETIGEKVRIPAQLHMVLHVLIFLQYRLRNYEGPKR